MAAARKTRKKRNLPSPVMRASDLEKGAWEKKRKGPTILTLAIMGGAAFFVLRGNSDEANANDGDGLYYGSPEACHADDHPLEVCNTAWENARREFEKGIPSPMSWEQCFNSYQNCNYNAERKTWVPVMAGFLLAQREQEQQSSQSGSGYTGSTYYSSGSHYYYSRPAWRDTQGRYTWRSRSPGSVNGYASKTADTLSRGGFGRASSHHSLGG